MVFYSMRAAPPTRRHLRHWEQVCRFLDAQPYRAVSLPFPADLPMSVRLFKRMALFWLVRHRDDRRWQLTPRWRAILQRLWYRLPPDEPAHEVGGMEEAERIPFIVDTGVDTLYVNLKASEGFHGHFCWHWCIRCPARRVEGSAERARHERYRCQ